MSRTLYWCCLCGAPTSRVPRPDGRALCRAHSTVALDFVPPDPLNSLPMHADELQAVEDAPPHIGTERC
jgi:hypothetical protein